MVTLAEMRRAFGATDRTPNAALLPAAIPQVQLALTTTTITEPPPRRSILDRAYETRIATAAIQPEIIAPPRPTAPEAKPKRAKTWRHGFKSDNDNTRYTQQDIEDRKKDNALDLLIPVIPRYAKIYMAYGDKGPPPGTIPNTEDLDKHARSHLKAWSAKQISNAKSALLRAGQWLKQQDSTTMTEEFSMAPFERKKFIEQAGAASVKAAAERHKTAKDAGTVLTVLQLRRDGSSTQATLADSFKFLQDNAGVNCGMLEGDRHHRQPKGDSKQVPATSLTVWALASFERAAGDASKNEFQRGLAAGLATITHAASRFAQAQNTTVLGLDVTKTVKLLHVEKDKNNQPSKQAPRFTAMPATGLLGTDIAGQQLGLMLTGVEDSQYILRETDGQGKDPAGTAKRWLKAPMQSARANQVLRLLLMDAGMSQTEAFQFTLGSLRHMLPETGLLNNVNPIAGNELGGWRNSASATSKADSMATHKQLALSVEDAAVRTKRARDGVLYSRYAANARVIIAGEIKENTLQFAREELAQTGYENLNKTAGWTEMRANSNSRRNAMSNIENTHDALPREIDANTHQLVTLE